MEPHTPRGAAGPSPRGRAATRAPLDATGFRRKAARLLRDERESVSGRPVVVFGIDGLSLDVAERHWNRAAIKPMRSVFPTTSSAGWLSELSGLSVDEHGVPGYLFRHRAETDRMIAFHEYRGTDLTPADRGLFSDARSLGYEPVAILGDLDAYPGAWRDALLRDADVRTGSRAYARAGEYRAPDPGEVAERLWKQITDQLRGGGGGTRLLWCYVELDQHIHRHGYDHHVVEFLRNIEQLALELVGRDVLVLAHSDHGLVPTRHDRDLERVVEQVLGAHGAVMGGAGRTRWIHVAPGRREGIVSVLSRELPSSVQIDDPDTHFATGSLARSRVGDVLLVAVGRDFLTFPGYTHDHGSLLRAELEIPFAVWS